MLCKGKCKVLVLRRRWTWMQSHSYGRKMAQTHLVPRQGDVSFDQPFSSLVILLVRRPPSSFVNQRVLSMVCRLSSGIRRFVVLLVMVCIAPQASGFRREMDWCPAREFSGQICFETCTTAKEHIHKTYGDLLHTKTKTCAEHPKHTVRRMITASLLCARIWKILG